MSLKKYGRSYYSIEEAKKLLGVDSDSSIYRLAKADKFKIVKLERWNGRGSTFFERAIEEKALKQYLLTTTKHKKARNRRKKQDRKENDSIFTAMEIAHFLGVSRQRVYKLVETGELATVRKTPPLMFSVNELDNHLSDKDAFYSSTTIAKLLNVSVDSARGWIKSNLPHFYSKGRVKVMKRDFESKTGIKEGEIVLTCADVAKALKSTSRFVSEKLLKVGALKGVKAGKRWRVAGSEVTEYLKKTECATCNAPEL